MSDLSGYFDFNATTPMLPAAKVVLAEMADKHWQNPSSLYREAGEVKHLLEHYREELADELAVDDPERIIFMSGATEANNAVVEYLASSHDGAIVVSAIEHPCVVAPVAKYFGESRVRELSVDPVSGVVLLDQLEGGLKSGEVKVVSVMAANNETGIIQPWEEISRLCRESGVTLHTDAAQWFGKLPCGTIADCGYVTGSGHKFGGGKGVGFLVLPEDELDGGRFHGLTGGPQEEGRRAGTENLPAIAAMVTALKERETTLKSDSMGRDLFEARVESELGCRIPGKESRRLWNTSMLVLPHSKNLKWLTRLSQRGFCVSTGSACSAGQGNPSRVMAAMGLDFEEMSRVLRVSCGWETTAEDWLALSDALAAVAVELE
ncbi:MAG: aminotransferase class V-fold PLP-dependent enzyme [Verrucomicrobiales bacterium]|nr:aminotransferase class V-fold PLP-dependent enzyme [Verrucomicrobiales bacterium]